MNIYVGNLSSDATEDDLKKLFEEFGQVESANIIKDKFSGESRGFGFVEMPNKAEADEAIKQADGKEINGTWKKTAAYDREIFYDEAGAEIIFNRGQLWICATESETTAKAE